MKAISKQRGLGMLQWALVIAVVGFFMLFAFKVVPMYAENRYVTSALTSLVEPGGKLEEMTNQEIMKKMGNFYMINNVRSEGPAKNIKIDRTNNRVLVTVDYETRTNFVANIDVVVSFKNHLDSTRPHECCEPAATLAK